MMQNYWTDNENGTITIYANGSGKKLWPVMISENNFDKVANTINGSWMIRQSGNLHYAIATKSINGKSQNLWMHRLITGIYDVTPSLDVYCDERFVDKYGYNSSEKYNKRLVTGIEKKVVDHRFYHNGLFNVDENLLIVHLRANSKNQAGSLSHFEYLDGLESVNPSIYNFLKQSYSIFKKQYKEVFNNDEEFDYSSHPLVEIINREDNIEILKTLKNQTEEYKKMRFFKDNNCLEKFIFQLQQLEKGKIDTKNVMENRITPLELQEMCETEYMDKVSDYFFPGHVIALYPNIKYIKALKPFRCNISGEQINKGQTYIAYRPLLDDLSVNRAYVLNSTIRILPDYDDYLPKTIQELETFHCNLLNSYEDEKYHEISSNLGIEGFSLKKLNKSRQK